jgi:hypothetical protein
MIENVFTSLCNSYVFCTESTPPTKFLVCFATFEQHMVLSLLNPAAPICVAPIRVHWITRGTGEINIVRVNHMTSINLYIYIYISIYLFLIYIYIDMDLF